MNSLTFPTVQPTKLKTEERIILAAMKGFSEQPIEAVTLRMIADEADITLSLITYHYKTKENLYREVLCRVLMHLTEDVRTHFDILDNDRPVSREAARELLPEVIGFLADRIYGSRYSYLFAKILIREHFAPSNVYETLYREFFDKMIDLLTRLVVAVTGNEDRRTASLQAFAVLGQIIGFRLERELLVRHAGLPGFTESETEELKSLVIRNTFLQLGIGQQ